MKRASAAIFTILIILGVQQRPFAPRELPVTAITHVTIIDITGASPQSDMTVLIAGERIVAVSKTEALPPPPDAEMVDGTDKFLIPGLWDMHVHALQKERTGKFFRQFIANGVLGIRDMGGPAEEIESIVRWRQQEADGELLGLRIVTAGPILDGPEPMFPGYSLAVSDDREAHSIVIDLKQRGVDFIKVYTLLTREGFFAIAEEANRQGMKFAGHVPECVSAAEASDAGQASIEHLSGVWLACSTDEEELRKELLKARREGEAAQLYTTLTRVQARAVATFSPTKADALFERFARNGTWQVPTLTVAWAVAFPDKVGPRRNSRFSQLRVVPKRSSAAELCAIEGADDSAFSRKGPLTGTSHLIARMRRAGVQFMAGTDAPNLWAKPGSSLHDELALLVAAGFTPNEALRTATLNPAKYFGLETEFGTVEVGKLADLVVLDANPLEDIANTRRISAVMVRGRMIQESELSKAVNASSL